MSDTATAGTTAQGAAPLAIKQGVPLPSRPRLLGDLRDRQAMLLPQLACGRTHGLFQRGQVAALILFQAQLLERVT